MPKSLASPAGTHLVPSDPRLVRPRLERWSRLLRILIQGRIPSAAAAIASLELPDDRITTDTFKQFQSGINNLAERALQSIRRGNHEESFNDVPLDLSHLSTFPKLRVVRACRRIGRGRVRTHGELAEAAGAKGAARAVGTVMSQNRFPIIVPCAPSCRRRRLHRQDFLRPRRSQHEAANAGNGRGKQLKRLPESRPLRVATLGRGSISGVSAGRVGALRGE